MTSEGEDAMKFAVVAVLALALFSAATGAAVYYLQPTLADIRDVVVIIYGVVGILLLTVLLAVAVGLYFAIRGLSTKVAALLEEPIRPALEELLETTRNARATSEFYADHAVNPMIKTVAAVRGIRKGFNSISRFTGRGKK